ncbi:hypothetical protein CRM22_004177 [Opisthorchis felineus]|uniref:Uncharacterized protein n=1 Tax=Opisthorchis felineus TaxID=147828 RepID=A0A4S2LXE5_OPIFE|nr:hypothetical protein CRM22_004177 [Opisthorchis felineus]
MGNAKSFPLLSPVENVQVERRIFRAHGYTELVSESESKDRNVWKDLWYRVRRERTSPQQFSITREDTDTSPPDGNPPGNLHSAPMLIKPSTFTVHCSDGSAQSGRLFRSRTRETAYHRVEKTSLYTCNQSRIEQLRGHHTFQQLKVKINTSSCSAPECGYEKDDRETEGGDISLLSLTEARLYKRRLATKNSERKMRYVKISHAALSEPDLSKAPKRSAMKRDKDTSQSTLNTQHDGNELREISIVSDARNSDSLSSVPVTPDSAEQNTRVVSPMGHSTCSSISHTSYDSDCFPIPSTASEMSSMFGFQTTPPRVSCGSPVMRSSGSFERTAPGSKLAADALDTHMQYPHEVEEETILRSITDFEIDSPTETDNEDDEVHDKIPRLHNLVLRKDSLGDILDSPTSANEHSPLYDDNMDEEISSSRDDSESLTDSPDVHSPQEFRRRSSEIPIVEVLSGALCAAGYGMVGRLLEFWLPQRTFCENLLLSSGISELSDDLAWQRRKAILRELARSKNPQQMRCYFCDSQNSWRFLNWNRKIELVTNRGSD